MQGGELLGAPRTHFTQEAPKGLAALGIPSRPVPISREVTRDTQHLERSQRRGVAAAAQT